MARMYGIANTDQVNRQDMVIPVHVLTASLETHVATCIRRGLPIGTPFHLSHDMHRPVGWSDSSMIHLGPDMARQLVVFDRPESEAHKAEYETLRTAYWRHHHHDQVEPFAAELSKRLAPADLTAVEYLSCEAPAFRRVGLAQELYPDLFRPGQGAVDKDGLVYVAALRARMSEVLPGVFHDRDRDILLFAHRFFRRSLSHANSLNDYALRAFADVLARHPEVIGRIRLDPDIVGYPGKALPNIELEYWRGPKFNDDIARIPSGVAEHKMEDRDRILSGVDKTQIWWKSPETRSDPPGANHAYRTFEVEELVENPSAGLGGARFGCRYAHAEYDMGATRISHFDGAIRAYDGEPYLERIEAAIDQAGKHADYTKLFRLDGPLPVADWKRLLCDFFLGNHLIPEYLGELPETAAMAEPSAPATGSVEVPALSALLRFEAAASETELAVITQGMGFPGDRVAPFVELGQGAVGAYTARPGRG
ncbi:MAG: hypothetical protein DI570_19605 [Phenylobacterium zucineum]|nr:MAG: hypothetical protein DI570_19605 [Phenylobacterium zucineum]